MARPNRMKIIHSTFFENQADRVKKAISLLTKEDDRLTNNQIEAVKLLIETYDWFFNPPEELLPGSMHCSKLCSSFPNPPKEAIPQKDKMKIIHSAFFENQADRVKKAISLLTKEDDRLTNNQIEAVKLLIETYDCFFNPPKELLPDSMHCSKICSIKQEEDYNSFPNPPKEAIHQKECDNSNHDE